MSLAQVTRVAAVVFPDWPAVAVQRELAARGARHDVVAVLHAQRVVACSPQARVAGVRRGMRRREAQAACADLIVVTDNPERERIAFEPVVRAISELVPLVEVGVPGTVVLPTRGPSRYVGGDEALAERLTAIVAQLSEAPAPHCGVGIADGRLMAMVAALSAVGSGGLVIPVGESATHLARQSVTTLSLGAENSSDAVDDMLSLLQRLGVYTLGDLTAIDEPLVAARFGALGVEMHRLARGLDRHPPLVVAPPPDRATVRHFEQPIEDLHVVVSCAREMATELCAHLVAHAVSCVSLHVSLQSEHGEHSDRVWYEPDGLGAAAVTERVRWQMDAWVQSRVLTSGVVSMRFAPIGMRALGGRQLGLWGEFGARDEMAVKAALRLASLLGARAVRVAEWRGGRDPAEAFARTPVTLVDLTERTTSEVAPERSFVGALPSPTPTLVHHDPLMVQVCDDEGRAIVVSGRHEMSGEPKWIVIDGERSAVLSWSGPWPIEERWWDPHRHRRAVRMHVVIEGKSPSALVLTLEQGSWRVTARYG